MLKRVGLIVLLIFMLGTFAACGNDVEPQTENATNQSISNYELPEREADLVGKVKEIIGNEVTVYKVEGGMFQMTLEERKKMREQMQNNTSGEMQRPTMNVSQETETFIIPVGTPIVLLQRVDGERKTQSEELTSIKKDSLLRVWKSEDGETVEFVQVTGNRGGGMNGNMKGGGKSSK